MISETHNQDCMEFMRGVPDKFFDLAVVDPPYGDGLERERDWNRFGQRFDRYKSITCTAPAEPERERERETRRAARTGSKRPAA